MYEMQKKYLVHIPLEYWLSRMQNKVKFLYIMGEKLKIEDSL